MEQEGQKEPRQLKIRGMGMDGVAQKGKLDKKEKEKQSGGKMWVVIILGITILACLVFSMKNRSESVDLPEVGVSRVDTSPTQKSSGGGFFKPAEYEFGN